MKERVKLLGVSYDIHEETLLTSIEASIHSKDRIGIIGKNGAGKSTLLQLLFNNQKPSRGEIQHIQSGITFAILEQEKLAYAVQDPSSLEVSLLEKWHVPDHEFNKLSGGEKLKARLAHVFATNADILLLDEPTNHLDMASTELLIKQMHHYPGAILFVSHNRYFLDQITTKIWAIEEKTLFEHKGNYTSYIKARDHRRQSQQRAYEKQQQQVEQTKLQLQNLYNWSQQAHQQSTKQDGYKEYYRKKAKRMDTQIKSKQKRLEKELDKANIKPVSSEYDVQFTLPDPGKSGKRLIEVKHLTKAFYEKKLFEDFHFVMKHGEKIALTGGNGTGKTTFLNIVTGKEVADGEVWISPSANIGYLTQEVFDLPSESSPAQLFESLTFKARGNMQNIMKHLGFKAAQWTECIGDMSMGERVKCKLISYILEEKDLLILDEPTNHLDLPSREQLETVLMEYPGTLLVVSHDRYFLEKVTNQYVDLSVGPNKQYWNSTAPFQEQDEHNRLALETARQEVLGKLSFLTTDDASYAALDQQFKELTEQIQKLKK